ncbi:MAG TPA: hypothetical protein VM935_20035 [Chitinophagaceae bacterium]|nr:hypothetical protein [Chitinophagaceae bacterium]
MRIYLLLLLVLLVNRIPLSAQTNKDIQGTWKGVSTVRTSPSGVFTTDSTKENLIKVITQGRIMFTVYSKDNQRLLATGQGTASTNGDQYTEKIEQSTAASLLVKPMIFTYKVTGNTLTYEGGSKDFSIVETLTRIE